MEPLALRRLQNPLVALGLAFLTAPTVRLHAAERVLLKNGFDVVCDRHELSGDRVRLYLNANSNDFVEVGAHDLDSVESLTTIQVAPVTAADPQKPSAPELSPKELHQMLAKAGLEHNLDVDLLASIVQAESGGHPHAVSRTGAKGLMQLMPGTAAELGVNDSFKPDENIGGGTAYLDALLTRYHENLALALAAYNAGPAAVDRYHGIPPYRETRLYVARVIREFNTSVRRNQREAAASHLTAKGQGSNQAGQIARSAVPGAGTGIVER